MGIDVRGVFGVFAWRMGSFFVVEFIYFEYGGFIKREILC